MKFIVSIIAFFCLSLYAEETKKPIRLFNDPLACFTSQSGHYEQDLSNSMYSQKATFISTSINGGYGFFIQKTGSRTGDFHPVTVISFFSEKTEKLENGQYSTKRDVFSTYYFLESLSTNNGAPQLSVAYHEKNKKVRALENNLKVFSLMQTAQLVLNDCSTGLNNQSDIKLSIVTECMVRETLLKCHVNTTEALKRIQNAFGPKKAPEAAIKQEKIHK